MIFNDGCIVYRIENIIFNHVIVMVCQLCAHTIHPAKQQFDRETHQKHKKSTVFALLH